jgi:DNA replication and repair protein RecF
MEWDIAAGQAILEALGGCVVHAITGEPLIYNKENLTIIYQKHEIDGIDDLANQYKNKLLKFRQNDIWRGSTSIGPHRDDLILLVNGVNLRTFGSQGQQKSFLIALKLAQFDFVKKQSGEKPILLFDDIFDKLDEFRVSKIIEMVNKEEFGQLFISDTHPERTENIVKTTHQSYKIFSL